MSILFNFRPNASVLPVLLITLFFIPVAGNAQWVSTIPGGPARQADSDIANLVGQLEHNALLVLMGAVILMGIAFFGCVLKGCAHLNRPPVNARPPFMSLLILVAGLSSFCSSCGVEQQAMAARYRAAARAENGTCPWSNHHDYYANIPFNNRYPASSYSNLHAPSFCKYCGQRVVNSRR